MNYEKTEKTTKTKEKILEQISIEYKKLCQKSEKVLILKVCLLICFFYIHHILQTGVNITKQISSALR